MKRVFLFLFMAPSFLLSQGDDFELLMGKETPLWKYVQTPEDFQRVETFKKNFDKNSSLLKKERVPTTKIPKTLHFIWLGPSTFPSESVERIAQWIRFHPGWKCKFWTDIDRPAPLEEMDKCLVPLLSHLGKEFYDSVNFGEKARLLSFEILLREGGIYVDHDVVPFKPFDVLCEQYDFFCGLEKLGPSIMSSSVNPSGHLIGACMKHPILLEGAQWLSKHWEALQVNFVGENRPEAARFVYDRTAMALTEGVDRGMGKHGNTDLILPACFFNDSVKKDSTFAVHLHEGKWFFNPFQEKVEKDFQEIMNEDDLLLGIVLGFALVSCIGFFLTLLYFKRRMV